MRGGAPVRPTSPPTCVHRNCGPAFDHIEIDFHDRPLAPCKLDEHRKIGFKGFAQPVPTGPQEDILGGLHGDGAGAQQTPAPALVTVPGLSDRVPIETVMTAKSLTVPLMKDIQKQAPQAVCELQPANQSTNLIVNRDAPPFDNPEIRRAMALALDRKSFIQILAEGDGDIGGAMQPPPQGVWDRRREGRAGCDLRSAAGPRRPSRGRSARNSR
jgi:extracellular solute-binding protein (family 5)